MPSVEWFVNPPEEPKENSGLRLPPSSLIYFPVKAVLSIPVSCLCGRTLTLTCRSTTSASTPLDPFGASFSLLEQFLN